MFTKFEILNGHMMHSWKVNISCYFVYAWRNHYAPHCLCITTRLATTATKSAWTLWVQPLDQFRWPQLLLSVLLIADPLYGTHTASVAHQQLHPTNICLPLVSYRRNLPAITARLLRRHDLLRKVCVLDTNLKRKQFLSKLCLAFHNCSHQKSHQSFNN